MGDGEDLKCLTGYGKHENIACEDSDVERGAMDDGSPDHQHMTQPYTPAMISNLNPKNTGPAVNTVLLEKTT